MSSINSNTDQQARTAYLAVSSTIINKFKCCISTSIVEDVGNVKSNKDEKVDDVIENKDDDEKVDDDLSIEMENLA